MRKEQLGTIMFLMGLIFAFATSFVAADEQMIDPGHEMKDSGSMGPGQEVMMAKWKEFATPNENHKVLNAVVGSWEYTIKYWMAAGIPPEESTGTSESTWIMGGKFVQDKTSGVSMGQPFEGRGIYGYNNGTGKYTSYWFDSMGTGSMYSEGTYDADAKTISSSGTFFCPFRGVTNYRTVLTITDDNSHTYEMYMTEKDGTEFLAMKIDYMRKK